MKHVEKYFKESDLGKIDFGSNPKTFSKRDLLEFAEAYAKQSSPSVPFISPELLAEWMHNNYEEIALNNGWKTQEDCQVPFHELPKENIFVMLELAERLLSKQSNWVSVEEALQLLSEDVDNLRFLNDEEQVEQVHSWIVAFKKKLLPEPPKQD